LASWGFQEYLVCFLLPWGTDFSRKKLNIEGRRAGRNFLSSFMISVVAAMVITIIVICAMGSQWPDVVEDGKVSLRGPLFLFFWS
jgi:hypothetical protein